MGMRGSVNSELFFEEMKVPVENRIGEEGDGFANLMKTLSMNRVFCAAQAVGSRRGRSTRRPGTRASGSSSESRSRTAGDPVDGRGHGDRG